LDDLIVGAYQANNNNPGKSYVVFGKTNGCAINLSAIADASNPLGGFVINGEAKYDYSGFSVSALMRMLSVPKPALNTSMPPLPVKVSLPAPATKISSRLVPASVLAFLSPSTGNRARVDGGGGVDTLKLDGAGLTLDLTSISNTRIQDFGISVGITMSINIISNTAFGFSDACRLDKV
jgi:hypothetical protein